MGSDVPIARRRAWLDEGNDITLEEPRAHGVVTPAVASPDKARQGRRSGAYSRGCGVKMLN